MDPDALSVPSPNTSAAEPGDPEGNDPEAASSPSSLEKKRAFSDGADLPSPKKPRPAGDMARVAEIVLVLSAMGRMRGGKDPSEVEIELMAEAREKLAAICENLAPKDIVGREAVGRVIEDLGLNGKARDQRLGFKVPKLSIAEKLAFSRRKMEETRKYPTHTAVTHPSQGSFNVATLPVRNFQPDKPSKPPGSTAGIVTSSLGNVASPSPANVSAGNSTSVSYHFGQSEVRMPTVSSTLLGTHLVKDSSSVAVPKAQGSLEVVEVGSVPPRTSVVQGASIVQANSSVNHSLVNAPAWPVQAESTSLIRVGSEKNANNHTPGRIQEMPNMPIASATPQAARDQTHWHIARASSGPQPDVHPQPPQAVASSAPLAYSNHHEIVRLVQKFLPPKLPEHPTWTPPSREYMNRATTCQICQLTINDVESVLLCDACEKGYHLRCLQSQNQRGIPKVEWHCQKCLSLSQGKPLPPKYGRVMRNMAAPKVTSIANNTVHSSMEKKMGTGDSKVNQQKVSMIESSGSHNPTAGADVSDNNGKSFSNDLLSKGIELQGNTSSFGVETQQNLSFQSVASDSIAYVSEAPGSADGSFDERSAEILNRSDPLSGEARLASQAKSEIPASESDFSSSLQNSSNNRGTEPVEGAEAPPKTCQDINSERKEAEESFADGHGDSNVGSSTIQEQSLADAHIGSTSGSDAKGETSCAEEINYSKAGNSTKVDESCADNDTDPTTAHGAQLEKSGDVHYFDSNTRSDLLQDDADQGQQDVTSTSNIALLSDVSNSAQWVGDVIEEADGKAFYGSCSVAGVTYKLNQHALFHSDKGKLVPSKLQVMWEDKATGLKWVKVNKCFFSGDFPENVGRPFSETHEVFESNHEETFMAGKIQGPCEVLHPTKYKEEIERRNQEPCVGATTLFSCKWFYDESKGHFQAVSS